MVPAYLIFAGCLLALTSGKLTALQAGLRFMDFSIIMVSSPTSPDNRSVERQVQSRDPLGSVGFRN